MYATYDELFSDPEIEFNIETNLGKFNSWTELSDKTTNIILRDYNLQLYPIPTFITRFKKLKNITFVDYNFDTNKIKFDKSFEIIKNILENKNIKINGCSFNIFLGDYYRNNENKYKAEKYYLIGHTADINAASKMAQYYSDYYSDYQSKYRQIVYNLLNKLNKKEYHTVYHVSLKYMGLRELPNWIGSLTNLQSLDLSDNELTELPDSISSLTNLQSLDLLNNRLTELPDWISSLINLQSLDLWGNKLTDLPDWIGSLTNLQSLDISCNKLTELPDSIGSLTNLQSLDISCNKLTELPDSIGSLTNLQSLHLRSNKLTELPDSFYKISSHCYIETNSKALLNNLPNNLEYLCFENLELPLTNLPYSLIELKLKECGIDTDKIKLPYGCNLIYE
jgi:hypothetical protein